MDFVLWVSHVMHVVSVVVWFGGLIFANAVMIPVLHHEGLSRSKAVLAILLRWSGFVWSSFWTALTTGLLLMVLSPRFIWFDFSTAWLTLLGVKQAAFLFIWFLTWQTSRVLVQLEKALEGVDETFESWRLTYIKLIRRSIFLGIICILCAAGMAVV